MNKLKAIQGVVIIMTSLIILGVGAVIYGLANRKNDTKVPKIVNTAEVKVPETLISEPQGSKISSVQDCGENICLTINGGGKAERIVILSSQGYVIRKIRLDFKGE